MSTAQCLCRDLDHGTSTSSSLLSLSLCVWVCVCVNLCGGQATVAAESDVAAVYKISAALLPRSVLYAFHRADPAIKAAKAARAAVPPPRHCCVPRAVASGLCESTRRWFCHMQLDVIDDPAHVVVGICERNGFDYMKSAGPEEIDCIWEGGLVDAWC